MPYFYGRREGGRVEISGPDARHLAGPLRARAGERVQVIEPEGRLLTVELVSVARGLVAGTVVAEAAYDPEPRDRVRLAVAQLPATALDSVLSRGVEVGAAGFTIVQARRRVARGSRSERWAAICREASMLAGRLRVPEVLGPQGLPEAWAGAVSPYLLDRGAPERLADLRWAGELTLFVGPEGGWSPEELELAGDRRLSLGPRNLRAETAALAGVVQALRGG